MSTFVEDPIFARWLESQVEPAQSLARSSDILDLVPFAGRGCRRFVAAFQARTLAQAAGGEVTEVEGFIVGISIPEHYLRRVNSMEVLTYLGPHVGNELRLFHPNVNPPVVCAAVAPGTPLTDLLYTAFELLTWQKFGVADNGVNPAAAAWARRQDPRRFPVDARPLKRKEPRPPNPAAGGGP